MNRALRSLLIALTIGALIGFIGIKGCSKAEPWPSTIVLEFSGDKPTGTVVVWAAPEDGRSHVYLHRFAEEDFDRHGAVSLAKIAKRPVLVLREKGVSGPPELARNEEGFLILANTTEGSLRSVATDLQLRPKKRQTVATNVTRLCAAPAGRANGFVAAWIESNRDGDSPVRELVMAALATDGTRGDHRVLAEVSRSAQCALGANNRRTGVVFTDQKGLRFASSDVAQTTSIDGTAATDRPLRLIPTQSGWYLLVHAGERAAEIIRLSTDGIRRGSFVIKDIDPKTIDIGANHGREHRGGVFASWIEGKEIRLAVYDDNGEVHKRFTAKATRGPHGVRAAGHGERCAVTWTTRFGQTVNVVVADNCI